MALFEYWAGMSPGLLMGWQPHGVYRRGRLIGIGVVHGTEIHFAAAPEWRGRLMLRHAIRDFLEPLFEGIGFLTTRVQLPDDIARRFVERIGFTLTRSDESFHYYMLSELPFGKET